MSQLLFVEREHSQVKFSRAVEFLLNRTLSSGSILKLPNWRATGINQGSKISGRNPTHSVEKREIFSRLKKLRENNLQYDLVKIMLISRNFCEKMYIGVNFSNFHTVDP